MKQFTFSEKIYIKIIRKYNKVRSKLFVVFYNLNPFISIGKNTFIEKGAKLIPVGGWGVAGHIVIGDNCYIGKGAMLIPQGGDIVIGDHSSVNPYTILFGMGGLRIGNYVRIGPRCVIVPQNHNYSKKDVVIDKQGMTSKGVVIGDDVWFGTGVTVLDGVTINDGCVFGGGAVVTKDTESYGVYVGVPAKKIKERI